MYRKMYHSVRHLLDGMCWMVYTQERVIVSIESCNSLKFTEQRYRSHGLLVGGPKRHALDLFRPHMACLPRISPGCPGEVRLPGVSPASSNRGVVGYRVER